MSGPLIAARNAAHGVAMTSRPLVALTTGSVAEGGSHRRPQARIYAAYIGALEAAGLASVLVTPFHGLSAVRALLDGCSGLVLSGGEDVDPARYGERPHVALGAVTPERDEVEMMALDIAMQRAMPVLAICRGAQVMNVFLGGTLYQDIGAQLQSALTHEQTEAWHARPHEVRVQAGSRLASIVQTERLRINSFHHQAIKDLGHCLEATAVAEDGVIECIEANGHPWALGVQWHPERHEATAPESDTDRLLFRAFGEAALAFGRG